MAVPEDCCSTVAGPAAPDTIILCRRGNCDFVQKVRMAQEAGAIAVVVANDQGEHLFKMYSSDENTADINVPSVFVTTNTGGVIPNTIVMLNATGEYNFNDDSIMHPYFFMHPEVPLGVSLQRGGFSIAQISRARGQLQLRCADRKGMGEGVWVQGAGDVQLPYNTSRTELACAALGGKACSSGEPEEDRDVTVGCACSPGRENGTAGAF